MSGRNRLKRSCPSGLRLARFHHFDLGFWKTGKNFAHVLIGNFDDLFGRAGLRKAYHDGSGLANYWRNAQNFAEFFEVPTNVIFLEGFFAEATYKNSCGPIGWLKYKNQYLAISKKILVSLASMSEANLYVGVISYICKLRQSHNIEFFKLSLSKTHEKCFINMKQ